MKVSVHFVMLRPHLHKTNGLFRVSSCLINPIRPISYNNSGRGVIPSKNFLLWSPMFKLIHQKTSKQKRFRRLYSFGYFIERHLTFMVNVNNIGTMSNYRFSIILMVAVFLQR